MMVMTEAPTELYDTDLVVPAVATADGELLGKVNDLPAGPWLAVLVDGIDPATLTGWDLPPYLSACQRVQSWAAARLTAGVDELASQSGPHGADKEVALALSEPVGAAQRRMWQARRLRRSLPGVWRAMAVGDLTERHASELVEATARIDDPELAAAVEQRVLAHAGGKTATELARYARRVLARLDPAGTQRRARAARDDADVHYQPGVDGMADVTVRAPVEDAAIVTTACDAYASAAKAAGDPRRVGVLRAEAPVRWASTYLTGLADGHVPRAVGRPIEVQITVPLRVALGLDELPAEVPGAGIIPAT